MPLTDLVGKWSNFSFKIPFLAECKVKQPKDTDLAWISTHTIPWLVKYSWKQFARCRSHLIKYIVTEQWLYILRIFLSLLHEWYCLLLACFDPGNQSKTILFIYSRRSCKWTHFKKTKTKSWCFKIFEHNLSVVGQICEYAWETFLTH